MSSSTVTESLTHHEGKLLVHIAENGNSFELDCSDSTLVEGVMRIIESVSRIALNDQLMLCLDLKLEPERPLSAYKLPCEGREVFVFNKARLQSNSPPPPPEEEPIEDLESHPEPQSPTSSRDPPHLLDNAPDPALKALPSYEREFRYHCHKGQVIYSRTLSKYGICERLLRELRVQERAVEVATGNLDQYYKMISQNCREFLKRFSHQHRVHSDLLVNFERDLERLRSVRVHPALQKPTQRCLLDFVKEDSLRKSAENCGVLHRQFDNKVSQFKQLINDVNCKVEEVFSSRAALPFRNLEQTVKDHHRFIVEQKSIMQSLRLVLLVLGVFFCLFCYELLIMFCI